MPPRDPFDRFCAIGARTPMPRPLPRRARRPGHGHRLARPISSGTGRRHFLRVLLARMAGAFLALVLRAGFLAGSLARFTASFSIATDSVIYSTVSVARSETLVVPSVMYGPKRPSLITIGFSLVGSVPSSFSGGLAAARPRVLGWA